MKILIVNTYDRGGAANACLRLHDGFLKSGIDSSVLLREKQLDYKKTFKFKTTTTLSLIFKKIKNVISSKTNTRLSTKEKEFLLNRSKSLEMFSFPYSEYDITKSKLYKKADVINLHWVAGFMDYESFFKKNKKPIIWTLHDMNAFSGGEHYLEEYLGMDQFGFPIKREKDKLEDAISKANINIKKLALKNSYNIAIVSPSKWLADEAKKSQVFKTKPVYCIPYGLDGNIFSPKGKSNSRKLFSIPTDKKVILFVADSINNSRKGFAYLIKAFEKLNTKDVILCAIGKKNNSLKSINNVMQLGVINDDKMMSHIYSAADVFIIPSLMDNLPNTVLESLMCGTPVIGFPVGGIKDMVIDNENGFLTDQISAESLVDKIELFFDGSISFDSKKIRNDAFRKYNLVNQAKSYLDLIENMLA